MRSTNERRRKGARRYRILLINHGKDPPVSPDRWLPGERFHLETVPRGPGTLRQLACRRYDIALVDIGRQGRDRIELTARIAAEHPDLLLILLADTPITKSTVRALGDGAFHFLVKPVDPEVLSHLILRAAEYLSLRVENIRLRESIQAAAGPDPIIGRSASIRRVREMIAMVSDTDATTLIRGESGTGKKLAARTIHAGSERRYNPFVVVSCGAVAEEVLESELFGYEAGACTGARDRHRGRFEVADGGTLFLDEVGDVSPRLQVELLRVLEEKTVRRCGGDRPVPVDCRVVAATSRDLEAMVRKEDFREELFWRLNVFLIEIPPLRSRPEDIPELAQFFLDRFRRTMSRREMHFSDDALGALRTCPWPGNVRELRNAVERAAVIGAPPTIELRDLPLRILETPPKPGPLSMSEVEKAHIQAVLDSTGGNISQAARLLEIDRVTLYNKIRKHHLKRPAPGSRFLRRRERV